MTRMSFVFISLVVLAGCTAERIAIARQLAERAELRVEQARMATETARDALAAADQAGADGETVAAMQRELSRVSSSVVLAEEVLLAARAAVDAAESSGPGWTEAGLGILSALVAAVVGRQAIVNRHVKHVITPRIEKEA